METRACLICSKVSRVFHKFFSMKLLGYFYTFIMSALRLLHLNRPPLSCNELTHMFYLRQPRTLLCPIEAECKGEAQTVMMFKAISQQNPGRFSGCSCSNSATNELQTQFQDRNLLLCCGLDTQVLAVFFPSCGSLPSSADPFGSQLSSSLQFEARPLVHVPCLVISSGQAEWEAGETRGAVGRPWG